MVERAAEAVEDALSKTVPATEIGLANGTVEKCRRMGAAPIKFGFHADETVDTIRTAFIHTRYVMELKRNKLTDNRPTTMGAPAPSYLAKKPPLK